MKFYSKYQNLYEAINENKYCPICNKELLFNRQIVQSGNIILYNNIYSIKEFWLNNFCINKYTCSDIQYMMNRVDKLELFS